MGWIHQIPKLAVQEGLFAKQELSETAKNLFISKIINFQIRLTQLILAANNRNPQLDQQMSQVIKESVSVLRTGEEFAKMLLEGALSSITLYDMLRRAADVEQLPDIEQIGMSEKGDNFAATDMVLDFGSDKPLIQVQLKSLSPSLLEMIKATYPDFAKVLVQNLDEQAEVSLPEGKDVTRADVKAMKAYARKSWPGKKVKQVLVLVPNRDSDFVDPWTGFINSDKGASIEAIITGRIKSIIEGEN